MLSLLYEEWSDHLHLILYLQLDSQTEWQLFRYSSSQSSAMRILSFGWSVTNTKKSGLHPDSHQGPRRYLRVTLKLTLQKRYWHTMHLIYIFLQSKFHIGYVIHSTTPEVPCIKFSFFLSRLTLTIRPETSSGKIWSHPTCPVLMRHRGLCTASWRRTLTPGSSALTFTTLWPLQSETLWSWGQVSCLM